MKVLTDKLEVINDNKPFSMKFNIPGFSNSSEKKDTGRLSFNDTDKVLDMGTNKESEVDAPKTIERLDKISREQNEKRKLEEEDDDYDDDGPLKISSDSISLDFSDVHDLEKQKKLDPPIELDIETLS